MRLIPGQYQGFSYPRPALGYFVANPGNTVASGAFTYERMYRTPMLLLGPMTVNRVSVSVSTVGTGVIRLGLYRINDNSNAQTLVRDFGTIDGTIPGAQEISIPDLNIPRSEIYAFAWAWQGLNTTSPQLFLTSDNLVYWPLARANIAANPDWGQYSTSVSGALPASAATVPTGSSQRAPRVVFNRSA
jgi:hypothetical protein